MDLGLGLGLGVGLGLAEPSVASSPPPLPKNSVWLWLAWCHFHFSAHKEVGGSVLAQGDQGPRFNPAIRRKWVGSRCATCAAAERTLRAAACVSRTWAAAERGEGGAGGVIHWQG